MKTKIKTLEEMRLQIGLKIREYASEGSTRFTGKVTTTHLNIEALEIELQEKGYWVEHRRIGGSDDFVIKVEW
jgi:hypothetical protein